MTTPAEPSGDQPRKPLSAEPDALIAGEYTVKPDSDAPAGDPGSSQEPRYLRSEPLRPNPFAGLGGFGGGGTPSAGGYTVYQPGPQMVDPSTLNLKNPFLAGLLGLVIGPLGLFYTTIPGALMLLAITAGLVWSGLGIVLPLIWVASATIGFGAALRHNARVMLAAMAQAGEGS